jgi:hypothetical protein
VASAPLAAEDTGINFDQGAVGDGLIERVI